MKKILILIMMFNSLLLANNEIIKYKIEGNNLLLFPKDNKEFKTSLNEYITTKNAKNIKIEVDLDSFDLLDEDFKYVKILILKNKNNNLEINGYFNNKEPNLFTNFDKIMKFKDFKKSKKEILSLMRYKKRYENIKEYKNVDFLNNIYVRNFTSKDSSKYEKYINEETIPNNNSVLLGMEYCNIKYLNKYLMIDRKCKIDLNKNIFINGMVFIGSNIDIVKEKNGKIIYLIDDKEKDVYSLINLNSNGHEKYLSNLNKGKYFFNKNEIRNSSNSNISSKEFCSKNKKFKLNIQISKKYAHSKSSDLNLMKKSEIIIKNGSVLLKFNNEWKEYKCNDLANSSTFKNNNVILFQNVIFVNTDIDENYLNNFKVIK